MIPRREIIAFAFATQFADDNMPFRCSIAAHSSRSLSQIAHDRLHQRMRGAGGRWRGRGEGEAAAPIIRDANACECRQKSSTGSRKRERERPPRSPRFSPPFLFLFFSLSSILPFPPPSPFSPLSFPANCRSRHAERNLSSLFRG